jgi:hypothetical protein
MELLAYHEQKTTWQCGGKLVLDDILGEMKHVLEGQQAEITIPFLISNDDTESLYSRRYNDYSDDTRFAVGKG